MANITIKDLLEAGTHFGHQKQRWNPKMRPYIYEERNGLYIIDLAKTMHQLRQAVEMLKDVVANHQTILFVGTKKQAKTVIKDCAEQAGEYYVCERWLGGMLTNLPTIRNSVKKLDNIERKIAAGTESGLTKKEISMLTKDQVKLERNLSGIRGMKKLPGLLVVVDPANEHIAVAEARKLGIPVMALVDTNCNPDPIDHVIPGNDDALKSVKLIIETLAQAVIETKNEMKAFSVKESEEAYKEETKSSRFVEQSDKE
ncbi:MAG: 30S ribosomal protein S2 [Chlamydiota bacterium]